MPTVADITAEPNEFVLNSHKKDDIGYHKDMDLQQWAHAIDLARFVTDPWESDEYTKWLTRELGQSHFTDAHELRMWLREQFTGVHFLSHGQTTPRAFGFVLVYLLKHPELNDRQYLHDHGIDLLKTAAIDDPVHHGYLRSWLKYRGIPVTVPA